MQPYTDASALIDDGRVLAVGIADNGERFTDAGEVAGLVVDRSRVGVQQLSSGVFQVRAGVAGRLADAQGRLPAGYQLVLKEGWRPLWVQERLWSQNLELLAAAHPDLAGEELHRENAWLVAPPGDAPRTAPAAPPTSFCCTGVRKQTWGGGSTSRGWARRPPGRPAGPPAATAMFSPRRWMRPGS